MKNLSSLEISDIQDEYTEVTQADLDRAVFRVGLKPSARKQSITIDLDENLIEYFKLKAGKDGYQSLINEQKDSFEFTMSRQGKESESDSGLFGIILWKKVLLLLTSIAFFPLTFIMGFSFVWSI